MLWRLAVALAAGGVFVFAARQARLLTLPAALVAGALGASIVGLGGWAWAVPSLVFFGGAAGVSRLGRLRKRQREAREGKGRDAGQVLANGGVAWGLLLAAPWVGEALCYWGFVGAFAAAAADTWATEVGTWKGGAPRSLRSLRRMPAGTSGAVSLVGTLAALGGAAVVAASAGLFASRFLPPGGSVPAAVVLVTGAGLTGAFADSLAGAFLQARDRNGRAGRAAGRSSTEGREHRLAGDFSLLTSDGVNVLCTVVGAAGMMGGVSVLW